MWWEFAVHVGESKKRKWSGRRAQILQHVMYWARSWNFIGGCGWGGRVGALRATAGYQVGNEVIQFWQWEDGLQSQWVEAQRPMDQLLVQPQ